MLNVKDLKKFCSIRDDRFSEPMSDDNFTYATNGHIIVRVKRINEIAKSASVIENQGLIFKPKHKGEWIKMPEYNCPPKELCPVCDGNKFIKACPECDREGNVIFLTITIITNLNVKLARVMNIYQAEKMIYYATGATGGAKHIHWIFLL